MAAVGRMLITGGSGFLGSVLSRKAGEAGYDVHATFYSNEPPAGQGVRAVHLDLRQSDKKTAQFVKTISPDVVIHTAYSQNDRSVTYGGTVSLARVCRAREVRPLFIFLSTDLVFDGVRGAYTEDDEPRPLMDYGRDKLDAEKAVLELLPDALVVRTSL
ncbi:MAG: sugar nucleotide-binding protein, partial [Gemmatimonadota bacterium]|nr:sugar nucleotide-binding protein [Gemmatimonadota bacterium]